MLGLEKGEYFCSVYVYLLELLLLPDDGDVKSGALVLFELISRETV